MSACDACLQRSALLAAAAGAIERVARRRSRLPALLALHDRDLVAALKIGHPDRSAAASVAAAATARGLTTTCAHAAEFPRKLDALPDRAAALFLRGDRSILDLLRAEPAAAVVGSRRASTYGLEVSRRLGRELAACGVPVVSGMAFGVDAAAHEGALDGGGPTVAVLACGADTAYPRGNLALYGRVARSGLVVSEMPPGFRPFRWCFPARNRIMAGLSSMTIVVEGAADSGSLITANFAAELGRDVGAVPGQVTSGLAAGPNGLLADGAHVVRDASDVLDVLFGPDGFRSRDRKHATPTLSAELQTLLDAVEKGEGTAEAIAGDPAAVPQVLSGLAELELLGLVRREAGGCYLRCS
ncbi:MAG: DNA-processing protein DprA [Solirubrobacterales bacterium]